jgi:hypothetical protein
MRLLKKKGAISGDGTSIWIKDFENRTKSMLGFKLWLGHVQCVCKACGNKKGMLYGFYVSVFELVFWPAKICAHENAAEIWVAL